MKKYFTVGILLFSTILYSGNRSSEWNKVRKQFIKTHNVCAVCGIQKDLQVHHIQPFHLYPELELDTKNLITLCISKYWGFNCHLILGHAGNFRYENPWIKEDIENIKIIGNPQYVKNYTIDDFADYVTMMKKRVKEFNRKEGEN